jgi:hypothetical protein
MPGAATIAARGKVRPLTPPQVIEIAHCESCASTREPILAEQSTSPELNAATSAEERVESGFPAMSLDVGIIGGALAEVVRQTWLDAGRTEVTSEETSPQFAEYAKKHSVLT